MISGDEVPDCRNIVGRSDTVPVPIACWNTVERQSNRPVKCHRRTEEHPQGFLSKTVGRNTHRNDPQESKGNAPPENRRISIGIRRAGTAQLK